MHTFQKQRLGLPFLWVAFFFQWSCNEIAVNPDETTQSGVVYTQFESSEFSLDSSVFSSAATDTIFRNGKLLVRLIERPGRAQKLSIVGWIFGYTDASTLPVAVSPVPELLLEAGANGSTSETYIYADDFYVNTDENGRLLASRVTVGIENGCDCAALDDGIYCGCLVPAFYHDDIPIEIGTDQIEFELNDTTSARVYRKQSVPTSKYDGARCMKDQCVTVDWQPQDGDITY